MIATSSAIALGADLVNAAGGRLVLVEDRFSNLEAVAHGLGHDTVDGVVFDLGVSSMQLDEGERGFSFRLDGPLDMRMGASGPSAADVVALASERDLAAVIAILGEERHARAVARAIVRARAEAPIRTTRELADIVARVVRARPGAIHPATRTFQALRIFVNEELNELAAALEAAERILAPGGRLVVVAFHSLEDRIVKSFFAARSGRGGSSRHQPELVKAAATFRVLTRQSARSGRGGDRRQSARALGEVARRRTHRCAGEPRACTRCCRGCRRLLMSWRRADDALSQYLRDCGARSGRGRCLQHQVRVDSAGAARRKAPP